MGIPYRTGSPFYQGMALLRQDERGQNAVNQEYIFDAAQIAAAVVTAFATIVLCWVTAVLAKETKAMADRTSEPHVVVTLEPSRWALHFFDMHIMNAGNAAAYGIEISFDPPLPEPDRDNWAAVEKVSVLRPGQDVTSSIGGFERLRDQNYAVTVKWRRKADGASEINRYNLSMSDYKHFNQLGGDPIVKISRTLERIEKRISN